MPDRVALLPKGEKRTWASVPRDANAEIPILPVLQKITLELSKQNEPNKRNRSAALLSVAATLASAIAAEKTVGTTVLL